MTILDGFGCSLTSDTLKVTEDNFASTISLGHDTSFCAGNLITLSSGALPSLTYTWSTGSNNNSLLINTTGQYSVVVTNTNNCIAKDTINVNVSGQAPIANFTTTIGCKNNAVSFTDLSIAPLGNTITFINWNFGNISSGTANTSAITLATGSSTSGFTAPNFVMSQVLVANGWSANGPDFVKEQTEALAVLSLAQRSPVKEVMSIVQNVLGTFVEELKPSSLKLGGEILPDYVPPDRLTAVPAAAPAPKKTATQRRDEEAAKQKAEADVLTNRIQTKVNALNAAIVKTQNTINTCKADKQAEFDRNYKECHDERYCSFDAGFLGCWEYSTRQVCSVKMPPGGWGTSYTPNADSSVACHQGLDAQIADLQAKLSDPDLQLAKTKSDEQLAANPSLGNDPVFMAQRNSALNNIAAYQAQINSLQRQKNGI